MLLNSIYGNTCSTGGGCGNNGTLFANNNGCNGCNSYGCNSCGNGCGNGCGCNSCGNGCGCNGFGAYGNNLGNAAYGFVGDWVNIVVTLTVLQSILGLVCNWNCGCGCGATTYNN